MGANQATGSQRSVKEAIQTAAQSQQAYGQKAVNESTLIGSVIPISSASQVNQYSEQGYESTQ